jgi:hypothetical protein
MRVNAKHVIAVIIAAAAQSRQLSGASHHRHLAVQLLPVALSLLVRTALHGS